MRKGQCAPPEYVLDSGIGVSESGRLMGSDGAVWRDISDTPSSLDITRDTSKGTQITTYGSIEWYVTPKGNRLAKRIFFDGGVKWVPLTGAKPKKARRVKVEKTPQPERLFDPVQYMQAGFQPKKKVMR